MIPKAVLDSVDSRLGRVAAQINSPGCELPFGGKHVLLLQGPCASPRWRASSGRLYIVGEPVFLKQLLTTLSHTTASRV